MGSFKSHQVEILNLGSQGTGGDAQLMVKAAILNTYRNVLAATGQEHRKREFSFGVSNGVSQYGLPLYVKYDLNFEDSTNSRTLSPFTSTEYDNLFPGTTTSGAPTNYYHFGKFGVQTQPSATGVVKVVSSSASDVTNFFVSVYGFDSSGTLVREKLTLNGTTTVTGTQSFATIERVVKSTLTENISFTGNITVKDAADNTLSIVPLWVDSPTYMWVEFYPIPNSAITYTLRAMAFKPDLVNDEDWPEFDEDFHNLLTYGAGMEVLSAFGKPAMQKDSERLYNKRLKEYQSWLDPHPSLVQQFRDVHMGFNNYPRYPWIKGVHFGLAAGE